MGAKWLKKRIKIVTLLERAVLVYISFINIINITKFLRSPAFMSLKNLDWYDFIKKTKLTLLLWISTEQKSSDNIKR